MNNESNTTSCLGCLLHKDQKLLRDHSDCSRCMTYEHWISSQARLLSLLSSCNSWTHSRKMTVHFHPRIYRYSRGSAASTGIKDLPDFVLPTVVWCWAYQVFYSMYCTFSAQHWYLPRVWLKCQRWAKHRYLIDDFLALPTKILALVFAVFVKHVHKAYSHIVNNGVLPWNHFPLSTWQAKKHQKTLTSAVLPQSKVQEILLTNSSLLFWPMINCRKQTARQASKLASWKTSKQTDEQAHRHTITQTQRNRDRQQTNKQTNKQPSKQASKQASRQARSTSSSPSPSSSSASISASVPHVAYNYITFPSHYDISMIALFKHHILNRIWNNIT